MSSSGLGTDRRSRVCARCRPCPDLLSFRPLERSVRRLSRTLVPTPCRLPEPNRSRPLPPR
jgi:hypothetical protein